MQASGASSRSVARHRANSIVPSLYNCRVSSRGAALRHAPSPSPSAAASAVAPDASPARIRIPGIDDEIALTQEPAGPGFIPPDAAPAPWVRPPPRSFSGPSIRDTGTLRPGPEWFPAWMRYRRREDNHVFWQDKFLRCSLDIPGACFGVLCCWRLCAFAAARALRVAGAVFFCACASTAMLFVRTL
jgi:hypothetical protein